MEDIFIRKAEFNDIDILFNWVNSNDSLKYKLDNKNNISYEEHKKWFLERLNDPNSYIWIIETLYKVSIGQIRFQQKENLYFLATHFLYLKYPIVPIMALSHYYVVQSILNQGQHLHSLKNLE